MHERNTDRDSLVNCCTENEHITNGSIFQQRRFMARESFRENGGEWTSETRKTAEKGVGVESRKIPLLDSYKGEDFGATTE